ncbi:hypothetical protein JCM11491_007031 [Sporobolomyces phaffii]
MSIHSVHNPFSSILWVLNDTKGCTNDLLIHTEINNFVNWLKSEFGWDARYRYEDPIKWQRLWQLHVPADDLNNRPDLWLNGELFTLRRGVESGATAANVSMDFNSRNENIAWSAYKISRYERWLTDLEAAEIRRAEEHRARYGQHSMGHRTRAMYFDSNESSSAHLSDDDVAAHRRF